MPGKVKHSIITGSHHLHELDPGCFLRFQYIDLDTERAITDGKRRSDRQCAPIGPTITQAVMKPITLGSSGRLTTLSAAPLHDSKQLTDGKLNYYISIPVLATWSIRSKNEHR